MLEISAAANNTDANEILGRMCHFVNSQWVTNEENCLDKIYFRLGSRARGKDLDSFPQCRTNIYFSVIYREFNYLDKSYVVAAKTV